MTDFIIILAEIFIMSAYFSRNILILRTLVGIGSLIYVAAAFTAGYDKEGMKALIFFGCISWTINTVQILRILYERFDTVLPVKLQEIHRSCFPALNTTDFLTLYKLAKQMDYSQGGLIMEVNQQLNGLFILTKGSAESFVDDKSTASLEPGDYIGEMSYIRKTRTIASVRATSDLECLWWSGEILSYLQHKKSELYNQLFQSIAINVVLKLQKSSIKSALPQVK